TAILHHHERYDGEGYPSRLKGEQIPLEARVIAVADAFAAMTNTRPYRERVPAADACAELERCAGTQFDPEVVRYFVAAVRANGRAIEETVDLAEQDPELELLRGTDE